jgi:trimeric autotransporter adhesin
MKRAPKTFLILVALLCCAGLLKATLPQTSIGKWTSAVGFSEGRSNASAVMLSDGRILITGGSGVSGPLQTAEFFATNGTVASAAAMNVARSSHFAVVLSDGRVLVGGGVSGGGTTNSAEVYDPGTDSWIKTNAMAEARANATAALLSDGRVLIAGGDNSGNASNTIELFDPSNDSFTFAGTLSAARTKHSMATLQDGRVLIVGGFDGTNPLASSDIFDPSSGNISAGPSLVVARYSASATTLLNGQVAVIGGAGSDGNGGTIDLASVEVFDASTGAFTTAGATLTTAREAHQSYLLPKNNSVLIVGGTSNSSTVAASELFTPQASPSSGAWTYAIASTGSNVTPRSAATGSAMQQDGLLLAAGGTDASGNSLASTELYAFPTVKTDAADYPPGTTVNITGHGFQPGENVSITFVESPLFDTHGPYTVLADANGNISDSSFTTDAHDVDIRFWLSAIGSQSGLVAQNTFTDGNVTSLSGTVKSAAAGNPAIVGATVTCTSGCTTQSTTSGTGGAYSFAGSNKLAFSTNGPVTLQLTASATGFNSQTITLTNVNNTDTFTGEDFTLTPAVVGTTTTIASSPNPSVFGSSVIFTATVTRVSGSNTPSGTVAIKEGTTTLCTTGSLSGSGGTATASCSIASLSVAGSPHTINAVYGGDTNFTASTSTTPVSQAVTTKALTVTGITANNKLYDGTTSATLNTAGATLNGFVNGDTQGSTVTLNTTGASASFADKSVGTGKTVTISSLTISGPNASNYSLTQPTTTANITGTTVTVTFSAADKIYDGTTAAVISSCTVATGKASGDSLTCTVANGTFASANANATAQTVSATATLTGIDSGNYTVVNPVTTTAKINPKPVSANLAATDKVYDGTDAATITSCAISGKLSGDDVSCTATNAHFASANASPSSQNVTATVALGGAASGNYTLGTNTTATTSAIISPKPVTASITAANKVYDGTDVATINSCTVPGKLGSDDVSCIASNAHFASANASASPQNVTATVALTGVPAGNYTLGANTTATTTAIISPKPVTASITAANKVYDGTDAATINSCTISGKLSTDDVSCTASNAHFASANASPSSQSVTATVALAGAAAGNYSLGLATTASTSALISPATITLSLSPVAGIYNGLPLQATCDVLSGLIGTDKATVTVSYTAGMTPVLFPINAGSYTATCASSGNSNYNSAMAQAAVTISPATLTVTAENQSMTFGGTAPIFTAQFAGFKDQDDKTVVSGLTFTVLDNSNNSVTDFTTLKAGSYSIVPSGATAINYIFQYVNGTLTVNKATFTGIVTTTAADPNTVAYGQPLTATVNLNSYSIGGVPLLQKHQDPNDPNAQLPESLTVYLIPLGGQSSQGVKFGMATAVPTFDNTSNTSGTTKTGWIATITAAAPTPGNYQAVAYGDDPGDQGLSGLNPSLADAGYFYPDTADITYPTLSSGKIDVVASTVTVTFTAADKTYDGNTTAAVSNCAIKSGKIGNDDVTCTVSNGLFATKSAGAQTISATAALGGTNASNYTVTNPVTTNATINQAPLTITGIAAKSRLYDGTMAATLSGTAVLNGVVSGDYVTLNTAGVSANFATKNVGTAKPVSLSGYTISGTDSGNYSLAQPTGLTADITQAPLSVIGVTAKNKVYDGTATATLYGTASLSGVISNDTVNLSTTGVTASFDTKNVGTAKPVTVSGYTIGGIDGPNYLLSQPDGLKADITPVTLTYTANSATRAYGATDPPFSGTVDGFITGENQGNATTGTLVFTTTADAHSNVGAYPINGSGLTANSGNYVFVQAASNATALTITKANATVVVTPYTVTYDGNAHTASVTSITGVNGETGATVGAVTLNTTHTNADTYSTDSWSFTGAANYKDIAATTITDTIYKATATVVVTPYTVTYDGNAHTATGTAKGVLGELLSGLNLSGTTHTGAGDYPADPWTFTDTTGNYNNANSTVHDNIGRAPLSVTADSKTKLLDAANPPLTATYSGFVNGETSSVLSGVLNCTTTATTTSPAGSYPITCSGQTSTNYAITYVPGTLKVMYLASGMCAGDVGHTIRQPINADGTSVFKQKSTVPAKFAVCDVNGLSIGTPGVVSSFRLTGQGVGTVVTTVDESVDSTTPDTAFRWDPTAQQWIFNMNTKSLPDNMTYQYTITLNDGSMIAFVFGLK